jgi:hypothetical protein
MDHRDAPGRTTTAVHLVAGWYDIFLRDQLLDYEALRAAGKRPYLTIGPWFHLDASIVRTSLGESIAWFEAHLKDDHRHLRTKPVRIYVMGANEWRDMEEWPPPSSSASRLTGRTARLDTILRLALPAFPNALC